MQDSGSVGSATPADIVEKLAGGDWIRFTFEVILTVICLASALAALVFGEGPERWISLMLATVGGFCAFMALRFSKRVRRRARWGLTDLHVVASLEDGPWEPVVRLDDVVKITAGSNDWAVRGANGGSAFLSARDGREYAIGPMRNARKWSAVLATRVNEITGADIEVVDLDPTYPVD